MTIFFNKYTQYTTQVQKTMKSLGSTAKLVILEDNPFLPVGISTPYEYYISRQHQEEHAPRELTCDALEIPEYWEIRPKGNTSGIYYTGRERAVIYFTEPVEKGIVQRIEWRMESGWIYKVDFYNKYGLKYATEFRDANGTVESRVFYSDKNQEVIVEHPGNDVVTLTENGMVTAFFNSHREFIEHFIDEMSRDEKCVLFVQDEKTLESLKNETDEKNPWESVWFPNDELLGKYREMGGENGLRFYAIPERYPENKINSEALILTRSDQIERIEELTQELPEMVFHIAANTLVSDKLNKLGERENVNIYPCVSQETLKDLWERCDFYLDINHWKEIFDAVNVAHQNNLLIMGFENTLHHRELLVKVSIFSEQDYKRMVSVIKYVIKNPG